MKQVLEDSLFVVLHCTYIAFNYIVMIGTSDGSRNFQRGFQVQEVFNNCDPT